MRRRFAYALNSAMARRGWKAPDLAKEIGRDASTVARWANGETVPNILSVKPLSGALGVRPEFLYDPLPVPEYPIEDYLLAAADSGASEAHLRATTRRGTPAASTPPHRPAARARGA